MLPPPPQTAFCSVLLLVWRQRSPPSKLLATGYWQVAPPSHRLANPGGRCHCYCSYWWRAQAATSWPILGIDPATGTTAEPQVVPPIQDHSATARPTIHHGAPQFDQHHNNFSHLSLFCVALRFQNLRNYVKLR